MNAEADTFNETDREGNRSQEVAIGDQALMRALTTAEIDVAITTAKSYPRLLSQFKKELAELVTLDQDVAGECMYALPRREYDKEKRTYVTKNITGPSARFAECALYCWGNSRGGARVINEGREFVTAQGVYHDLQKNTHITYEVQRRITNRDGNRFSSDMIMVTGNAANSIALRNAVLKGIPKPLWHPAYLMAKQVTVGTLETLANFRAKAMVSLQKLGATPDMIFAHFGIKGIDDIGLAELELLRGIFTAIKNSETTVEKAFEPKEEEGAHRGATTRAEAAKEALRKANPDTTAETNKPAEDKKPDPPPKVEEKPQAAQAPAATDQRAPTDERAKGGNVAAASSTKTGYVPSFPTDEITIKALQESKTRRALTRCWDAVLDDYADSGRGTPPESVVKVYEELQKKFTSAV